MNGAAIVIVVVGIVLIWAVFVRPSRKQQKEAMDRRERIQSELEPGVEVVTAGGMYVTVVEDRGEELLVELSPGVQARIDRRAVFDLAGTVAEEAPEEGDGSPDEGQASIEDEHDPVASAEPTRGAS